MQEIRGTIVIICTNIGVPINHIIIEFRCPLSKFCILEVKTDANRNNKKVKK